MARKLDDENFDNQTIEVGDLSKLRVIAHFEVCGAHEMASQIADKIKNSPAREIACALMNRRVDSASAEKAAKLLRTHANALIRSKSGKDGITTFRTVAGLPLGDTTGKRSYAQSVSLKHRAR